jgi:DNA-damage-inducible protein D
MGDFNITKFEDSGHENGTRYWHAHEFMASLGYDTWTSFQAVITKAMGSCAMLGLDPTESFIRDKIIENGKEINTYRLNRFACFLVSMHADSRKPEVATAKTALAAIADRLIQERINDHDISRLEVRDDLKTAEKALGSAAQDAGLQSQHFGIFKDAGFRGMYNMSLKSLMTHKGIDGKNTIYDFMGIEELAGNLFRATQTAAKIRSRGIRGLDDLNETARAVGSEVRGMMINNSGTAPEHLPVEENISSAKRRLKSAAREMKKLDGSKKKKSHK